MAAPEHIDDTRPILQRKAHRKSTAKRNLARCGDNLRADARTRKRRLKRKHLLPGAKRSNPKRHITTLPPYHSMRGAAPRCRQEASMIYLDNAADDIP